MESSDTESSWSVYSDCDCFHCQYGYNCHSAELESYPPFYSSIQQPFVYFAQCCHGHVKKKDCKICRPNCFVRAFRWYTNEHGENHKPCEPVPCKEECKDSCDRPNISSFALWLDSKYQEFLTENTDACRIELTHTSVIDNCKMPQSELQDTCGRKKTMVTRNQWKRRVQKCQNSGQNQRGHKNECSRNMQDLERSEANNMSIEFIMTPKNLSHAASECCHPTPICSGGDGHIVKSQSATATVCLNKSGYGNQEFVKPPVEQKYDEAKTDAYKTNKNNISCQVVVHSGKNAQTQYEPTAPCDTTCPTTPRCPSAVTNTQPTQRSPVNQHNPVSKELPAAQKHAKSIISNVDCKCYHDLKAQQGKQKRKNAETKSTDFQQSQHSNVQQPSSPFQQPIADFQPPASRSQQPYPNSQQPCPDFQQPCPSLQQQTTNVSYPCPSVREPCPGFRPCPTLHGPCSPCEKGNLPVANTVQQREQDSQFRPKSEVQYPDFQKKYSELPNPYEEMQNPYSSIHKPCPDFQKPCPSLGPVSNISEPCPSLNEPCPGNKTCPSFLESCPPCPQQNARSTNIQRDLTTNSQIQYQRNAIQREPTPDFQIPYQQQTKFDSQTRYQQQIPMQKSPQMRFESQTRYQQSGPTQQSPLSRFDSQTRYQQPGSVQQESQMRYSEKNIDMQYYGYNSNHNPCCNTSAIRREGYEQSGFVEPMQRVREMLPNQENMSLKTCAANVGFQEQYRAPREVCRDAGPSAETFPGPSNTYSSLVHGTYNMNSNCHDTYPDSFDTRCCKRMQTQQPPVKNIIITTATAEGKCSANCPYYASVSNKGETTQTVQFSQHSRDTTAQTSSTAVQLDRSTNPEYKLFMKVVCADKL